MYRIEVAPGEEAVFRTIEELATAIRNGLVTTRSRIYHNASQKWLPIEFHPHYKKALASLERPKPFAGVPAAGAPAPAAVSHPEPAPTAVSAVAVPAQPAAPRRAIPFGSAELPYIQVELPKITYPEVKSPAPVDVHEERLPVARRRVSGGRPVMYAAALAILGLGGYLAASGASPASVVAEPAPVAVEEPLPDGDAESAPEQTQRDETVTQPAVTQTPLPASEITSAPPRVGPPSQAWSSSAGAVTPIRAAPAPVPGRSPEPAIDPPPAALDLALPSLPAADSLALAPAQRDSTAIKRILRAVTTKQ
jgi:hypothetical protein